MQLKDYQNDVLESLSRYLQALAGRREEADEVLEFQRSKGRDAKLNDYCRETWDALHAQKMLPLMKDKDGHTVAPQYVARKDGLDRPVPNICLKVPTGGGKTLLGTVAVERINAEYFKKQTGFVLWIVPSDAIYSQTWKAFANREHPYRQMLERASGGRVRLLEKSDSFTKQDVDEQLCVMLMMLQAGAVKKESKEARKMFQDSGKFPSFFPDVDDASANKKLFQQIPNLDNTDLTEEGFRIGGLTVKQSLGNVFKLVRPIVVIDEGHKAYSNTALDFIAGHNPRFLMELSATPNSGKEYVSNVLVNVTGTALQKEQMIKLPINLDNQNRADWKHTLSVAQDKLADLQKDAEKVRNNEGRYIRPIMLIRVERTGKEQRDKTTMHAEDIREYLVEKLGAQPDEIKVKSAELDELGDENLLSELSKVRYIITKDALREGWDCPFAYILAVLSKTTAATALTQMIGRVLRQTRCRAGGQTHRAERPRHEPRFLRPHSDVGCHPQSWRVMETALTYTLQRVHWQFFGTLTFKSARLPERVRLAMFFALVRCVCRWHKVPFRKCVWALRQESGEISGRLHFHFLIAGLPLYAVQDATAMSIKAQWEKLGGGMARVREYDSRKQGLEYTLKCLNVTNGGANLYEVGKFSHSADEVMLSNSIWNPANLNRVSDTLVTA